MLKFHQKCLQEFGSSSGLLVTGRGLGDWRVVLQTLNQQSSSEKKKPLVLIINYSYQQDDGGDAAVRWNDLCTWWAGMSDLPQAIDGHSLGAKRKQMYSAGGMYFVTSRILVADLLNHIVGDNLCGVIVLKAHTVTENSNEAFVIRMILQHNPQAFVRAFSDSAQAVSAKTLPVLLRSLHMKRVFLYPRFRQDVRDELDINAPELIEIAQPMSSAVKEIQSALVDAMRICVDEIKRTSGALDFTDLTVESTLFRAFDLTLRQRLDATWHTTTAKTKQLFQDVKTVRQLLKDLTKLDCVSFYEKLLETKQKSMSDEQEVKSMWLFTNAAERIFTHAKSRLFTVNNGVFQLVLEPNLKIQALQDVLAEIRNNSSSTKFGGMQTVVLVRDSITLSQITGTLASSTLLRRKFLAFFTKHVATLGGTDSSALLKQELANLDQWRKDLQDPPSRTRFLDEHFTPENCFHATEEVKVLERNEMVAVHLINEVKELGLLDLLQPSTVIVFDADVGVMREIECHHAARQVTNAVRCYWIYHENSFEEQSHASYMNQERDAFLRLIQQKSELVFASEDNEEQTKRIKVTGANKVVVDAREFNAALPNMLQLADFELDARTLQVGDYILSPEICVERKSLSDLVSSFNDGRLFNQAMWMSRAYDKPVLLIEFPENGPFRLNNPVVSSRLVLLCLHFPKLRIIWSKSYRCTVDLFRELQRNQTVPDGDKCEMIQASGVDSAAAASNGDEVSNYDAFELLKQLPGVTKQNCFRIARGTQSLVALCKLDLTSLQDLCEGEANGKLLYDFLRRENEA